MLHSGRLTPSGDDAFAYPGALAHEPVHEPIHETPGDASSASSAALCAPAPDVEGDDAQAGPVRFTPRQDHAAAYAVMVDAGEAVSVEEAYAYCRNVARHIARTFYYGSLFLPPEKRRPIWAIYAYCRTADDIADEADLHPEPEHELTRWREALEATYAGRPQGPVMTAWADMLQRYPVPIEPALELLEGARMDIGGARFQTFDDLRLYCYRVAGTVGLLTTPVLGYTAPAALAQAVDLGIAMQLTNILRDIGEDAATGRVYIPDDELARFGYSREELLRGVRNDAFLALMEFQIARAEEYYARGFAGVAHLARDAQLAIALSGELYRNILQRIRRNDFDVFTKRAHVPLAGKLAAIPGAWLRVRLSRA